MFRHLVSPIFAFVPLQLHVWLSSHLTPASPPVEPTLALYRPIECSQCVIDDTVRELASRAEPEVLPIDAVQVAPSEIYINLRHYPRYPQKHAYLSRRCHPISSKFLDITRYPRSLLHPAVRRGRGGGNQRFALLMYSHQLSRLTDANYPCSPPPDHRRCLTG